MNRYRNYMDRITAPPSLHEKLLAGETPRRRKNRHAPALVLAAACCLLAVVGLWRPWSSPQARDTAPNIGAAATPAATQPEQEHTLYVEDPFQGQPHGFFNVTGLAFPDCTHSEALLVDYAFPEGCFPEEMTAQEIITALGGTDEVPWVLCWANFGLDGSVLYDGDGQVFSVFLHGVNGDTTFTLTLFPGQYPPQNTIYTDAVTEDINGLTVTSWSTCYDSDGDDLDEYTCHVDFQYEDLGVSFTATGPERDAPSWLANVLAQYGYQAFTTEHLSPASIPEWRAETLTQERVYEDEMAVFFPDPSALPDGFSFAHAQRTLGPDQKSLTILFTRGYSDLSITVTRFPAYASNYPAPDFQPGEVTAAALEDWGYVDYFTDYEPGDTPGWRYDSFTIHYPQVDGSIMAVTWAAKGISPSDLAGLVNGTTVAPPEDGPQVYPLE